MTNIPYLIDRLAETEYASFDDGIHGHKTPFGDFVTHPDFPGRWDCNQILRCKCSFENVGKMLDELARLYEPTGLKTWKISGHDPETDEALGRILPGMGWKAHHTIIMAYERRPSGSVKNSVEVRSVDPHHPDLEALMAENGRLGEGFAYHRSQSKRLGGEWLVAYLNGKPAGTTGWFLVNGIGRFRWVGTEEWARRQGVATAMIRYVQDHPAITQADKLTIFVGEEISDAYRLYESLGFVAVGRYFDWLKQP